MKVFVVLVLVLCNHLSDGYSTKDAQMKTWKHNADITNENNWIDGKMQPDCKGVIFAERNSAPIFVEELHVEELQLPIYGELWLLDSGYIQVGRQGGKSQCVKLKRIDYEHYYDWTSWIQETNNSAVPHQERIPCFYDSVNFPNKYHTRTYIDLMSATVAQVKYGDFIYTDTDDFNRVQQSDLGKAIFMGSDYDEGPIRISRKVTCPDSEWPCPCHLEYVQCMERSQEEYPPQKMECETPIQPYGFCHDICGAFLTIELEKGFDMGKLKRMLEGYESDTHASVVDTDYGKDVVQVVFAEKVYRMKSTLEIEDFRAKLLDQKMSISYYEKSGLVYVEGKTTSSTVSLIFGTFFGVLLVFAVFFTVFKDGDAAWLGGNYLRARFNQSGSRSFFDPMLFARFDPQNENLIVDGQSLAGSVQNLHQRSFDNPMFGQASREQLLQEEPQSVGLLASALVRQKSTEESNEVENPLYDIALKTVNEE